MNVRLRTTSVAVVAATLLLGGCATRGQLRRGLEEQAAAQQAALAAERAERVAGDQRLASDIATLRSDLESLRTEFGAIITTLDEGMQFVVPVHFAFDGAEVQAEAQPVLNRFSEVVQRHYAGSLITVEGFADPAGSAAYNKTLSQRRADAVREYLALSGGLPYPQLRAVGYGEERQVVEGAERDEMGAELNRRVVFVVETPPSVEGVPAQTTLR